MKKLLLLPLLLLTACADTVAHKDNGGLSLSSADADGNSTLSYEEFRRYAHLEAAGSGADAMNQRMAEQAGGNRELHKRFIALDHDNNGQISQSELR